MAELRGIQEDLLVLNWSTDIAELRRIQQDRFAQKLSINIAGSRGIQQDQNEYRYGGIKKYLAALIGSEV